MGRSSKRIFTNILTSTKYSNDLLKISDTEHKRNKILKVENDLFKLFKEYRKIRKIKKMFGTFQEHPKVNINKNIIFIMKNLEKLNQNQKKTKIKL